MRRIGAAASMPRPWGAWAVPQSIARPTGTWRPGEPGAANVRAASNPPNAPGGTARRVGVIGVFLPDLPEGLSSATGIRKAGRSAIYIVGVGGRDHGRQRYRCPARLCACTYQID